VGNGILISGFGMSMGFSHRNMWPVSTMNPPLLKASIPIPEILPLPQILTISSNFKPKPYSLSMPVANDSSSCVVDPKPTCCGISS